MNLNINMKLSFFIAFIIVLISFVIIPHTPKKVLLFFGNRFFKLLCMFFIVYFAGYKHVHLSIMILILLSMLIIHYDEVQIKKTEESFKNPKGKSRNQVANKIVDDSESEDRYIDSDSESDSDSDSESDRGIDDESDRGSDSDSNIEDFDSDGDTESMDSSSESTTNDSSQDNTNISSQDHSTESSIGSSGPFHSDSDTMNTSTTPSGSMSSSMGMDSGNGGTSTTPGGSSSPGMGMGMGGSTTPSASSKELHSNCVSSCGATHLK